MKNKILQISVAVTQYLIAADIILALILIYLMIAWSFKPDFFNEWYAVSNGDIFMFETRPVEGSIPLSEYGSFFFYFLCLKALAITGILFIILRTSIKVIRSISSLETFKSENVKSFRRMGALFIAWLVLNIPTILPTQPGASLSASLELRYAVWALICYVLAEIFSEGNKLMEDNKLTI